MKLNDEIINRYIDGELSSAESAEVQKMLAESPEFYKHYKAVSAVHNKLKFIRGREVSSDFTSMVMGRIDSLKLRKKDSVFILSISSIFVILSIVVTGIVAWHFITSSSPGSSFSVYDESVKTVDFLLGILQNFKNSKGFSILGAVFSFGILISGYFFFEHQRSLKRN